MTLSNDDGRRALKGYAGLAAAALIGAFLLATTVLLGHADAASAVCRDPVSLEKLRGLFPDLLEFEGKALEYKLGPIAGVVGVNPDLDYAAVTSVAVQVNSAMAFVWFVEDGRQACWGAQMTAEQWRGIAGTSA